MSNKIEVLLPGAETVSFATDRPNASYFGNVDGNGGLSIYLQEVYAFGIHKHPVASYALGRWLQWTEVG